MLKVLPMILFGVFFESPHLIRGDIPIPNSWEDFFSPNKISQLGGYKLSVDDLCLGGLEFNQDGPSGNR